MFFLNYDLPCYLTLVIPTIEALLATVERLGGQKSHLGCRPRCGSQIAGTLGMSLSLPGPHFYLFMEFEYVSPAGGEVVVD